MRAVCGLILFSMLISSAFSLKCYLCEGANGTTCAEPSDASDLTGILCPTNQTELECVTFSYRLDKTRVNTARGCSPKGFCNAPDIPFFEITSCFSCSEDLCNNAIQQNANVFTISLFILSLTLFFTKFFQ